MVSLSIHGGNLSALITLPTPFNTTLSPKTSFSPKPNSLSLITLSTPSPKRPRSLLPSASAAVAEALETAGGGGDAEKQVEEKERLGVVVKVMEKPRLVLRFIWMEKNIGVALDQVIPGHGTIPLSPYFWWPRKDAWEELKSRLEEKPWISQKRMIVLLNQATDIINLWQQGGDATKFKHIKDKTEQALVGELTSFMLILKRRSEDKGFNKDGLCIKKFVLV